MIDNVPVRREMATSMKLQSAFVAVAMCALAGCAGGCRSASGVRLEAGGTEILVAKDASKTVDFASREMQGFLGRVLGEPVPIVNAPTSGKVAIVLGSNDWSVAAGIDTAALRRDAFVTKVEPGRIYIAGRDDPSADIDMMLSGRGDVARSEHATVFGVYAFLEDVAGCRFFFPGEFGTVVPRAQRLVVPYGERTTAPVFTVRDPYLRYAGAVRIAEIPQMSDAERKAVRAREDVLEWLRLRLQTERIPCCHGQNGFAYTDRFRETHPEYLRLKENGKRATELEFGGDRHSWRVRDLCHTSKVWDEIYEDVKAYLTGAPASSRGIPLRGDMSKFGWNGNCVGGRYVDIMPQDGFQRCCCENCKKAYTDESNYATDLIWGQTAKLANRLKAEGVKGYVTQMAYSPYGRVPAVDLPDNVLVMVARTGPWSIRNPKVLEQELADYRAWAEKTGGKVWIWTYPHKYGNTAIPDVPCMAPRAWGEYYKRAAPWIFGSFAECETDRKIFNYLNCYVFSKVAWDTDVDLDALLEDHYAKMFGAGAAEMKRVYEDLEDTWLKVAGNVVWDESGPHTVVPCEYELAARLYSPEKLAQWSKLCDEAFAKNASDPDAQKRVCFIRGQLVDRIGEHFRSYMDGLSVEKALARRASEPKRPNLVDPEGWSLYPSKGAPPLVDKSAKGPSGGDVLHVRAIDGKAYLSGLLRRAPHLLKPNTRYRLSCFLKLKDVAPRQKSGGVYLEMNNGQANWAESNKGSKRFSGTTEWVYHEMEFETSAEISPKAFFCLRILNASGEAWFDGVRLEEVEKK